MKYWIKRLFTNPYVITFLIGIAAVLYFLILPLFGPTVFGIFSVFIIVTILVVGAVDYEIERNGREKK